MTAVAATPQVLVLLLGQSGGVWGIASPKSAAAAAAAVTVASTATADEATAAAAVLTQAAQAKSTIYSLNYAETIKEKLKFANESSERFFAKN